MYVSIKDVAARAGVSFQTASKVLNDYPGVVSAATRERIRAAAEQLGYVPNALARGLVRQTSLTVGILADDFSDVALSRFVVAAQRAADAEGHASLVVSTSAGADPARAVRRLLEHRVQGVIVVAPSLENDPRLGAALGASLPVVSLNHIARPGTTFVGSDHAQTGSLAAEHLLSLGHERMATVTGIRGRRVATSRYGGFCATLAAAGVALAPAAVGEGDWTPRGGFVATRNLLDATPCPTALFVQTDVMAMGALGALRERGIRVPEQCSVVGCDDLSVAAYLSPPLTTVRVSFEETGTRAVQLLLRSIRGEPVPDVDLLPVHLVVRQSTARPPPAEGSHVVPARVSIRTYRPREGAQ